MRALNWAPWGLLGGVLGAAVWSQVAYRTGWEIGYLAALIGLLVGLGIRFAAESHAGETSGIVAAVIAALSIFGAKVTYFSLTMGNDWSVTEDREMLISYIADDLIDIRLYDGEPVEWPSGADPRNAYEESDYPAEIWQVAVDRLDSMSVEERSAFANEPYAFSTLESLAILASQIVGEGGADSYEWPDGQSMESAFEILDYPLEVQGAARDQWNSMGLSAQLQFQMTNQSIGDVPFIGVGIAMVAVLGALMMLTPWDLLWTIIAIVVAYRTGAGLGVFPQQAI